MNQPATKKVLNLDNETGYQVDEKDNIDIKENKPAPMIQATEIGMMIALPITLGTLFGLWLDNKFLTHPKLLLSGLLTGVFLSFTNLYFIVKQFSKKRDK